MIHDLSGKEKSALHGAAEIALGLMGDGVEAPRVPRPEIYPGDPLPGVHKRHENAVGKELCGMCLRKKKDEWECGYFFSCPSLDVECHRFLPKPSTPRPPQSKRKGLPVPEGVKFLYVGRPPKGVDWSHKDWPYWNRGVVTVAWITPAPGILHLGFSFCSPQDRWCKGTGRDMALARLLHPLVIPFLYDAKRTVHEVVRAVLTHDFGRIAALSPGVTMWERVPSWTRGLGKRMMGGTGRERRGETLGEKFAWLHAQGIRRNCAPLFEPTGAQILAHMMRDITQMEDK